MTGGRALAGLLFAFAFAFAGCKHDDGASALPPAVGSGVPAPEIPAVGSAQAGADPPPGSDAAGQVGTGTLEPSEQAELGPKASGTLAEIKVEEGDLVKHGQVLFRLDSSLAYLSVKQAEASLQAAQANLSAAELDLKRTKELLDRGSLPPATYDQAKSRYDAAAAGAAQGRAALSMAKQAAADTVIRSPIDGVVTQKLKSVGETVTMMPATTVLIVQNVARLKLEVRLPERALQGLSAGDELLVSFPALGLERRVPITRINPGIDPHSRTIEVVAEMDNADGRLRPGMLAQVTTPS